MKFLTKLFVKFIYMGGQRVIIQVKHILDSCCKMLSVFILLFCRFRQAAAYQWLVRWQLMVFWTGTMLRSLPACFYHHVREQYQSHTKNRYKSSEQHVDYKLFLNACTVWYCTVLVQYVYSFRL